MIQAKRAARFETERICRWRRGVAYSVGSVGNEERQKQRLHSTGPGFNTFGFILMQGKAMGDFQLDQHNLIILTIL